MHEYKIEVFNLNEEGTRATDKVATRYADSHEQAKLIYEEYFNMKREDGTPMYKVNLLVNCYKLINSPSQFFAQFNA